MIYGTFYKNDHLNVFQNKQNRFVKEDVVNDAFHMHSINNSPYVSKWNKDIQTNDEQDLLPFEHQRCDCAQLVLHSESF